FFVWYPCPMTRRQGENHAGDAIAPQNAANDTLLKSLRSLRPTRGGGSACRKLPTTRRTRRLAAEVSPSDDAAHEAARRRSIPVRRRGARPARTRLNVALTVSSEIFRYSACNCCPSLPSRR